MFGFLPKNVKFIPNWGTNLAFIFVSLPKGEEPLDVDLERAKVLIDEKVSADAPVAVYKGEGVQKGTGNY